MPMTTANGVDLHYELDGDGRRHDRVDQRARGRPRDLGAPDGGLPRRRLPRAPDRQPRRREVQRAARPVHEPHAGRRREGRRRRARPHRLPPDRHVDGRDDRPGVRDQPRRRPGERDVLEHLRGAGPVLLADVRDVARHGHDHRRPVHHARRDVVGLHRSRSSRSGRTS